MKYITILILSLFLISCDNDSIAQETETIVNTKVNRLPEGFIGEYKHHYGEEVTGTISITKTNIIINTSEVQYNININSSEITLKPWCNDKILDITFIQCKKKVILRITDWKETNISGQGADIILSKDYNIVGRFDLIKEEFETPINNHENN